MLKFHVWIFNSK